MMREDYQLLRSVVCIIAAGILACSAGAETAQWTLTNHAGAYSNELVRLKVSLKTPYDATSLVVTEDGREVPVQAEIIKGTPAAVEQADLWVCTTISGKASHEYTVRSGLAPKQFPPLVKVLRQANELVLDNGLIAVKLPAKASGAKPPGPITSFRAGDGQWLGSSEWQSALPVVSFSATVLGDGPLFGKVRLRYEFAGAVANNLTPLTLARHAISTGGKLPANPFAEITITLAPDQPLISIEESHAMMENNAWILNLASGWQPQHELRQKFCYPGGGGKAGEKDTLRQK